MRIGCRDIDAFGTIDGPPIATITRSGLRDQTPPWIASQGKSMSR
jgi:hypothetical protein